MDLLISPSPMQHRVEATQGAVFAHLASMSGRDHGRWRRRVQRQDRPPSKRTVSGTAQSADEGKLALTATGSLTEQRHTPIATCAVVELSPWPPIHVIVGGNPGRRTGTCRLGERRRDGGICQVDREDEWLCGGLRR